MNTFTFPANQSSQTEQKKKYISNTCDAESYFKRIFFRKHYEYELCMVSGYVV